MPNQLEASSKIQFGTAHSDGKKSTNPEKKQLKRGRSHDHKPTNDNKMVEVEDVKSVRKSCKYLRGNSATTRLPEDAQSYRSSIDDPLSAPLSNITDDYHNFGGGVNPLGYKGHTFTSNGYGPVYVDRSQMPQRPPPSYSPQNTTGGKHWSPRSFDDLIDKITSLEYDQEAYNNSMKKKQTKTKDNTVTFSRNPVDSSSSISSSTSSSSQDDSSIGNPETWIIGSVSPFCVSVTLSDMGESKVLGDNWYMLWRVLYLITCFACAIIAFRRMDGAASQASCAAITYATIVACIAMRRALQFRLVKSFGGSFDNVHNIRHYSWFDVVARQAAPVMCLAVGLLLPGLINAIFSFRGIAITYYQHVSFYLTAMVTIVTMLDIWLGLVPTRATYITPISLLVGIVSLYLAWGFTIDLITFCAGLTGTMGLVLSLLLHVVSRLILLNMKPTQDSGTAETTNNNDGESPDHNAGVNVV